jgi:hypothetical protein
VLTLNKVVTTELQTVKHHAAVMTFKGSRPTCILLTNNFEAVTNMCPLKGASIIKSMTPSSAQNKVVPAFNSSATAWK